MKIVNRCAITISYKQPFADWNDMLFPDMLMESHGYKESYTYLVKEEMDISEKIIKKYYKQIFEDALEGMCTDENKWPKDRTFKLFTEWFDFHISGWVVDLVK